MINRTVREPKIPKVWKVPKVKRKAYTLLEAVISVSLISLILFYFLKFSVFVDDRTEKENLKVDAYVTECNDINFVRANAIDKVKNKNYLRLEQIDSSDGETSLVDTNYFLYHYAGEYLDTYILVG